jgi:hypothetical protein
MFGVSEETTTRGCCVEAKVRILSLFGWIKEFFVDLMAEAKARLFETLMAIFEFKSWKVQLQRLEFIDDDIEIRDEDA